jgi:hypothetical protein
MGFIEIIFPKKRKRRKLPNTARLRKIRAEHNAWLKTLGIDKRSLRKRWKKLTKESWFPNYTTNDSYPPTSDKIPVGNSVKKERMQYSGERKLIGIATMHKSNQVPVFEEQDAKDIANMRR